MDQIDVNTPSPCHDGHRSRFKVPYSPLQQVNQNQRGDAVPAYTLYTWIARHIGMRPRLERICVHYLMFLMVTTTKHSLEEAARFSAMNKSQFSKFLKFHHQTSVYTLESLSKTRAKRLSKALKPSQGLPWKIALIIDATVQHRSSLHPKNAQRFNHGQGFVIRHQWTNIILILNDMVIPLRPIPFYSRSYCRENNLTYMSEHKRVVEYLSNLNLEDYIGSYDSRDVVVLTDSGYDNKQIEKTISDKKWIFIIALKKKRGVKSEHLYATTPKSKQWSQVCQFFRHHSPPYTFFLLNGEIELNRYRKSFIQKML